MNTTYATKCCITYASDPNRADSNTATIAYLRRELAVCGLRLERARVREQQAHDLISEGQWLIEQKDARIAELEAGTGQ